MRIGSAGEYEVESEQPVTQSNLIMIEKYTVNLYFRHFAWAYAGAFLLTLFFSGIVTFNATEYSPQTDKITLFYGMFNPCILFDHYPAKVVATAGMGIFLVIGIAYGAMLALYVYCDRKLVYTLWSWPLILMVCMTDLVFVNVFTTNLYPLEDPSDQVRRLHGVHYGMNNTISLVEESLLTGADISIIKLHTTFYIAWIAGQMLFSFHLFTLGTEGRETWRSSSWAQVLALNVLGWYGMIMHAAAMLIIVMHPEPKVEWYFKSELSSIIQHVIIYFDAKTFTSAWGWVPIMLFRLIMPEGRGISLTFSCEPSQDHEGKVSPVRCLKRVSWGFVSVLGWGGVFDPLWRDDASAEKLVYSLRSKPFAYFGAPMFLMFVVLLGIGLWLQLIQKRLAQGQMPMLLAVHAGALFASVFAMLLVILDKANWILAVGCTTQALLLTWVLHVDKESIANGRPFAPIVYCLSGLSILIFGILTSHWWLYFAYLCWLGLYGSAMPEGPTFYISVARIEEEWFAKYREVSHNADTDEPLRYGSTILDPNDSKTRE